MVLNCMAAHWAAYILRKLILGCSVGRWKRVRPIEPPPDALAALFLVQAKQNLRAQVQPPQGPSSDHRNVNQSLPFSDFPAWPKFVSLLVLQQLQNQIKLVIGLDSGNHNTSARVRPQQYMAAFVGCSCVLHLGRLPTVGSPQRCRRCFRHLRFSAQSSFEILFFQASNMMLHNGA